MRRLLSTDKDLGRAQSRFYAVVDKPAEAKAAVALMNRWLWKTSAKLLSAFFTPSFEE